MKVPVVLPVVRVVVGETGELTVDIDGSPHGSAQRLCRDHLRSVLDEITAERDSPVRVEVYEADGTAYADIATPPTGRDHASNQPVDESTLVEMVSPGIRGSGFRPGEQVAVAYVLLHQTADERGRAAVHLPPSALRRRDAALLLFGLDSKTATVIETTA
jgi:hypothetical protein